MFDRIRHASRPIVCGMSLALSSQMAGCSGGDTDIDPAYKVVTPPDGEATPNPKGRKAKHLVPSVLERRRNPGAG